MTKKIFAALICVLMLVSAFAGCKQQEVVATTPVDSGAAAPAPATESAPPAPEVVEETVGPDGREFAEEQVYRTLYSSENTTMNYLSTGTTAELVVGANCIDSLVENDSFGAIVPSGAVSWETSADGLTWTFHLREGQYWYDADGNQKDPVTAHDYVAAARYVCDATYDCSNSYLMEGWLVNAEERYAYTSMLLNAVEQGTEAGEDQDVVIDANGVVYEGSEFDTATGKYKTWTEVTPVLAEDVGAVAVDDYTLEYKLVIPRPYFLTVLQFGTYWPAPAAMLEELGANFALDNYTMWFNGAYILSTFKPQEKRIYTRNENNWDAEHVYIERIEETYNTEASTLSPEMFLRGTVDYAGISADIVTDWLADPEKAQLVSTSRIISDYSYFMGFNFEPKFDAAYEPANWSIAVNNENFRQAIFHGLDRYNATAARFPADDPEIHIINTVTPRGFATNEGVDFVGVGDLAAVNSAEFFDEAAALEFKAKAVEELTAAGCTFPIKIPMNYNPSTSTWGNECVVIEQQLEKLLGADFIDIIVLEWSGQSFLRETRRNGNYAIQVLNWGADYMDPETWTDPFAADNNYNFFYRGTEEYAGIDQNTKTEETLKLWDEYEALVNEAKAEYNDIAKRHELFAAAEAFYINHAIVIPMYVSGGSYQATKLNAFEGQYAAMGQSTSRYKGQHLYATAMSQDMFDEQQATWRAAMGD